MGTTYYFQSILLQQIHKEYNSNNTQLLACSSVFVVSSIATGGLDQRPLWEYFYYQSTFLDCAAWFTNEKKHYFSTKLLTQKCIIYLFNTCKSFTNHGFCDCGHSEVSKNVNKYNPHICVIYNPEKSNNFFFRKLQGFWLIHIFFNFSIFIAYCSSSILYFAEATFD